MVFVTAGMGGGTGTGAAPVIAQVAKDMGALTVAVVTKPFFFEGKRRQQQAERGIKELREIVDSIITIPNDRLLTLASKKASFVDMLAKADEVLFHAVKGISDLIMVPGLINLDFADVKAVMQEMGLAMMGTGIASGEGRAREAAMKAITSPLLEDVTIDGARGVLMNITCGPDLTIEEVSEAAAIECTTPRMRTPRFTSARSLTWTARTKCASPSLPPAFRTATLRPEKSAKVTLYSRILGGSRGRGAYAWGHQPAASAQDQCQRFL